MNTDMTNELDVLTDTIKSDYINWRGRVSSNDDAVSNKMIAEFNDGIGYTIGSKYIRIMNGRSVWGFVVNTDDDKKFKKGDILKPAGWKTPTRNFSRGNIIEGGYTLSWAGS
jgi:hypothetical protein